MRMEMGGGTVEEVTTSPCLDCSEGLIWTGWEPCTDQFQTGDVIEGRECRRRGNENIGFEDEDRGQYSTDSDVLVVPHLEIIINLFFRCNLDISLLTFCSVFLGPKQPHDNSGYPAKGVDGGLHVQANLCVLF